MSKPRLWSETSSPDIGQQIATGETLALLPIGAIEQHGAHLPTGVDIVSAETVCRAASAKTGAWVLPGLAYGCSQGHTDHWPGTISLSPHTLSAVIEDICSWVFRSGIRKILLINGHYTNFAPLRCALENLRCDLPELQIGIRSLWELSDDIYAEYHQDGANWHANKAETSLYLFWKPELVQMEHAVDEPDRSAAQHSVFSYRVNQETHSGIVGNATEGNAAHGEELAATLTTALCDIIARARTEEPPLIADANSENTAKDPSA